MSERPPFSPAPAWVRALRPSHWTKNLIVLAAYFFAHWDPSQRDRTVGAELDALLAMLAFCAASSAIYLLNDIRDVAADREHPQKRLRPLASGELGTPLAAAMAVALAAGSLAGAWLLGRSFGTVVSGYVALQAAYSLGLKRIPLLDIFVIAAGFVLRAVGGAAVLDVRISPWLLLCTFLLALFLGLCKRRHEKLLLASGEARHREALVGYDRRLLDQLIAIASAATIVSYAVYTLSEETVRRFGTNRLGLTIPLVLFGIFRYLDLVYRHEQGGRPEKTLLTDPVLLGTVLLYGLSALLILATA